MTELIQKNLYCNNQLPFNFAQLPKILFQASTPPPLPLHSQISLSSHKSLVSNGLEITQVTAGSFIEELWYVLIREYYSDESVLIIN